VSWVNHLNPSTYPAHRDVLATTAKLFERAVPDLELVSGHRLTGKTLQVVVRSYEQHLHSGFYKISDWHVDGKPEENIVATAVCYLEVGADLKGGEIEFQCRNLWVDDPTKVLSETPRSSSLIAFNNCVLRHRVGHVVGSGHRRLVAFHVLNPDYQQLPRASALPRQLRAQCYSSLERCLGQLFSGSGIPTQLIADYAVSGDLATELISRRDEERRARLDRTHGFRYGTGVSELTGTGTDGLDDSSPSFSPPRERYATGTDF